MQSRYRYYIAGGRIDFRKREEKDHDNFHLSILLHVISGISSMIKSFLAKTILESQNRLISVSSELCFFTEQHSMYAGFERTRGGVAPPCFHVTFE